MAETKEWPQWVSLIAGGAPDELNHVEHAGPEKVQVGGGGGGHILINLVSKKNKTKEKE